jgi:hypothetical protein
LWWWLQWWLCRGYQIRYWVLRGVVCWSVIYSFIHSSTHPSIHPFIHPFIHSFVRSFVHHLSFIVYDSSFTKQVRRAKSAYLHSFSVVESGHVRRNRWSSRALAQRLGTVVGPREVVPSSAAVTAETSPVR